MQYPAKIENDGAGWVATFRDVPEAIGSGKTRDEAIDDARDALETAMEFYVEDQRRVPAPSQALVDEVIVALPASVAAQVAALNASL